MNKPLKSSPRLVLAIAALGIGHAGITLFFAGDSVLRTPVEAVATPLTPEAAPSHTFAPEPTVLAATYVAPPSPLIARKAVRPKAVNDPKPSFAVVRTVRKKPLNSLTASSQRTERRHTVIRYDGPEAPRAAAVRSERSDNGRSVFAYAKPVFTKPYGWLKSVGSKIF